MLWYVHFVSYGYYVSLVPYQATLSWSPQFHCSFCYQILLLLFFEFEYQGFLHSASNNSRIQPRRHNNYAKGWNMNLDHVGNVWYHIHCMYGTMQYYDSFNIWQNNKLLLWRFSEVIEFYKSSLFWPILFFVTRARKPS